MNARSFFTEQDFAELKSAWTEKRKTGLFDHEKTVKVNGNTYTLSAYVGQYVIGDRNFFASGMIQYNYACFEFFEFFLPKTVLRITYSQKCTCLEWECAKRYFCSDSNFILKTGGIEK